LGLGGLARFADWSKRGTKPILRLSGSFSVTRDGGLQDFADFVNDFIARSRVPVVAGIGAAVLEMRIRANLSLGRSVDLFWLAMVVFLA
jgi:hypothetical protein